MTNVIMNKYNPQDIEQTWQKKWEEEGLYKTPKDATHENKMYVLPQLPYPSGSGLHVGHAEVYTACDMYARYQRMAGKKVLQVIGWDSFGLPAENYAIKTNVHPKINTEKAIDNFRSQIKSLGISVDWDREVASHHPDYYKWTQWFFLLFYKRGLAYRKKQAVNWCDSCKTVLANDQVKDGHCERCDTLVVQRDMEQWFLKITQYADKLLEGLDKIDWPEETKKRQRDWIGRSEGAEIQFIVHSSEFTEEEKNITVFTTRPDTLFGATYMVLAPEHELIKDLESSIKNYDEVKAYVEAASKKTELDRQSEKEKTGVELEGVKAVNPVNGQEIPVWVADYVLASYGTGAIMAVPAHDERDWEFAKKYNLPVKGVIIPYATPEMEKTWGKPFQEDKRAILNGEKPYFRLGVCVNSNFLDGLKKKKQKKQQFNGSKRIMSGSEKSSTNFATGRSRANGFGVRRFRCCLTKSEKRKSTSIFFFMDTRVRRRAISFHGSKKSWRSEGTRLSLRRFQTLRSQILRSRLPI